MARGHLKGGLGVKIYNVAGYSIILIYALACAYFAPPRNVRERLAQQLGIATIKEYALQDCGTLEATQMGLESRAVSAFPLGDQEFMVRHLNKVVYDWVDDYQRARAEV